jgi:formylglycine-generating enzyme
MSNRALLALMLVTAAFPVRAASVEGMALLPSGRYTPLYMERENTENFQRQPVYVEAFWLDREPVTNLQFLDFVTAHPEWKKSQVRGLFADSRYLQHWSDDSSVEDRSELDSPVVNVSWFAASAYCEAREERLPTTDEWEYALADNGRDNEKIQQQVLAWYAVPNGKLPGVGSQPVNGFGISGLAGLVWEWTSDFNGFMASSDSRDSGQKNLFCGGGSLNASNPRDYAAFMRYSYRGSLQGAFTGRNLGFRCAKDAK